MQCKQLFLMDDSHTYIKQKTIKNCLYENYIQLLNIDKSDILLQFIVSLYGFTIQEYSLNDFMRQTINWW